MKIDFVSLAIEDLGRWDSKLVELVKEEKLNPWDIDIVLLTGKYLEEIKKIRKLDFRIPAKVVLTAAVLLRLKSEKLFFKEKEEKIRQQEKLWLEVPELKPLKRVVERKITVFELLDALKSAFDTERSRLSRRRLLSQVVKVSFFNMTELLESLKEALKQVFNEKERVSIQEIANLSEFVLLFVALLHLANANYIELKQEAWNSEIFVGRG